MKNLFFVIILIFPVTLLSQIIDWDNFSEEKMNEVMFSEMNEYVKITHSGDSLILSSVIQNDIMTRNYNLIKNNHRLPLHSLHNSEWINDNANELHDTLKSKIIEENASPRLIETIYLEEYNLYTGLSYMEILQSSSYPGMNQFTYQDVAREFIDNWNTSPPHAAHMNANYHSKVIVGVSSYYHRASRMIFISFVYVS